MAKMKLRGTGLHKEKDGREVIETTLVGVPVPCKQCKKEPRRPASSRCTTCSTNHKVVKAHDTLLRRKIERQAKKDL